MSSSINRSEIEILIVEDSRTQAEQLAALLEHRGYTVRIANDGRQALEMMREAPPSLVISDIVMPNLDGYGMCHAAKRDDRLRNTPIILVTTLSDPSDVLRGLECGADNFIRKPVDERYLMSRIEYLLMNRELRLHQKTQMGIEIDLRGQRYFINSDRQQMLDLLISTYEQAVDLNSELSRRERELADSNEVLDGLYRIADELNRGVSVAAVIRSALSRISELPDVRAASITIGAETNVAASGGNQEYVDSPSQLEFPLVTHDSRPGGVLRVAPVDDEGFAIARENMLASVSNQISVALERAHLFENLEQLVGERTVEVANLNRLYSMLSGINTSIVRIQSVDELFKEVCRVAVDEGDLPFAWVALTSDATRADPYIVCTEPRPDHPAPTALPGLLSRLQMEGYVSRAFDSNGPLVVNDVQRSDPELGHLVGEKCESIAILPLYLDGGRVGVFVLHARDAYSFDDKKEFALLNEIGGDISFALGHQEKTKQLNYLAYFDNITELPNRALFADRLHQALADADRQKHTVAVAVLDLDRFKTINDSLGHSVGDMFLKAVAHRFQQSVREGDTVARLAGDEFAFIFAGISKEDNAGHVIGKIMACFSEPFGIAGHELFSSASVGLSMFPADGRDSDELIRNADAAMYRAKSEGRNTYQFYSADMTVKARERLSIENALRTALKKNEFLLHYQPVVDLQSGTVVGVEALIRWQHPERGLVPPFQFIPIAEESSLIVDLGAWVLEEACRQVAQGWRDVPATMNVAVNVSTKQFLHGDFYATVSDVLGRTGLAPGRLTLEITESHLMHNLSDMIETMKRLGDLGIQFSIDDFGTGYSSLSYLRQLPIANLKVDRSFIMNLPGNTDDASITEAIISMAHSLKQRVIAEGVETVEQLEFLRAHGCDAVQGYYFSKPLPAADLVSVFERGFKR